MKLGIIGAGPGGYEAALYAAQRGIEVTLFEKQFVGGTCLNLGCIPTKTILASTELYSHIEEASQFGIKVEGAEISWEQVQQRMLKTVAQLRKGVEFLLKKRGVRLINAEAFYLGDHRIEAGGQTYEFDNVIIATGSRPAELPGLATDKKWIINSNHFFTRKELPKRALVVGTGAIGLELSDILRAFGTELTVVELVPQVMPLLDSDASSNYARILSKKGIKFIVGNSVKTIEHKEDHLKVTLTNDQELEVDQIVVGVGRTPNSEVIKTDKVQTERGKIKVNNSLVTSEEGTYAIGDVAIPPVSRGALAHVASHEGIFAVKHILGEANEMDWHAVPWVVFTDPPLAAIGQTEKEASQAGLAVKTYTLPYRALGAAVAKNRTEGFCKFIVEADTGRILGVQMAGVGADLIINEMAVVLQQNMTVKELSEVIHAHPTLSEVAKESAFALLGYPINTM